MIGNLEFGRISEASFSSVLPCFRTASLEELHLLDTRGYVTRALQDRVDAFSPERRQDKFEAMLLEYLDGYASNSPVVERLMSDSIDNADFIAKALGLVTGLDLDNETLRRISRGEASAQETRVFFGVFAPKNFNVVVQTATSSSFSNLFSVTYGGVLETHVHSNSVLLELAVPVNMVIFEPTLLNYMENELLTEIIDASWILGQHSIEDEVVEMLKRRQDLPVQKFLRGVDLDSRIAVNKALHSSKGKLIRELL